MEFKLLKRKDAPLETPELNLRIRLGFVQAEHIAELQGIFLKSKAPQVAVALYALREFISELELDGSLLVPRHIGLHADVGDADTRTLLKAVSTLVINELLVSEEYRKKSASVPSPGTGESETAQTAAD